MQSTEVIINRVIHRKASELAYKLSSWSQKARLLQDTGKTRVKDDKSEYGSS